MTMSGDQLREEFETWASNKWPGANFSPDQNNCGIVVPERYKHPKLQVAWEAYQAGRDAQQPRPEVEGVTLDGCLETLFRVGEHLGIDYVTARKAPVAPSDVYIKAIEDRAALQHSCKETSQDAEDENTEVDAAVEAVRKQFCALPRYSFVMRKGGVSCVHDSTGNWIEFNQAHALFDPISVDHARSIEGGGK